MNSSVADTHLIVLPGGGYAEHARHEAEPVASWRSEIGQAGRLFARRNAGSDCAVRCALLRHHLDGNRDIPSCPADPPGRGRQPSAAPVDLTGFAGYPAVAALLHLAYRGGRV